MSAPPASNRRLALVAAGVAAAAGAAGCGHRGRPSAAGPPADAAGVPIAAWQDAAEGMVCRHPATHPDCQGGWCRVPAGCDVHGSPDSEWGHPAFTEKQRAVTLTHGLLVGEHEVTQGEWRALGLPDPSGGLLEGGGDCTDGARCPVGNVTWFEAAAYANKLSAAASPPLPACYQLDGCTGELGRGMTCTGARLTTPTLSACDGFRLPTGAEWEYFARAGTRGAFYGGDLAPQAQYSTCTDIPALDGTAWYCANSGRLTHPVGAKQPNAWGLHDVLGNAHEWTEDAYDGQSPPPGPAHDPGDGAIGSRPYRIIRGGGATSWSHLLRSACAALNLPWSGRAPTVGFRLVRTIDRQGAAAGEPPG